MSTGKDLKARYQGKIHVRNYRKSDYEATLALMEEMSETFDFYFDKARWTETAGLRSFAPGYSRTTLVAEIEGVGVVGMGFIELQKDPNGANIGYLSNWGVKKEYRGTGVGRVLANKAIALLTKMGADLIRIKIAMNPDPSRVLQLVKRIGFEPSYMVVEKKIKEKRKEHDKGAGDAEEK